MSRKLTDEDVLDGVECEGVGYWLTNYCSPEDIENPELRKLAARAKEALIAFEEKIDEVRAQLEEEE